MSDDLNTEIKIGADASGVEAGVSKAKRSLASLGDAANKAGKDGGKGIELLGVGGDKAAKKVESATRSMQNSIQRLIAEQKAGEKGSRAYYEALADSKGINRNALKPLLDQLDDAKRKTDAAKNSADDWRSSLGKINGAAVGAAIAATAVGIGAIVTKTIDAADSFSKLSAKSGIAVESLRELNYAASLSDVSTESLATGVRKLSQNMAAAAGGAKQQTAAFDAIGVSVKNVDGSLKGADQMVKELASKFATFKDGPEKAALAIELFGKQGAEMIPLLNGGAAGLAEMADEANRLGIVFDGDLAKNAEAFNDNLTRIQTSAEGAAVAITKELLPTLNNLAQAFVDAQGDGQSFASWLGSGLRTVVEAATIAIANVSFVLTTLGRDIGAIGAAYASLAKLDIQGFKAISEAIKEDDKEARRVLDKFTFDLLNARFLTSKAGAGRGTAPDPRALSLPEISAPIVKQSEAATKGVKTVVSEYDKLIQKLSLELPKAAAEAEEAQNGYNKAQTEFVALANSPAWAKFTNQQRANVAALFENKIASEQAADATKALAKANLDAAASREKYITSLSTGLDKIQADIAAQIEATERMGLSKEAIAELDAAKLEMLATDLELQAIKAMDRNLDQQTYDALKAQAQAYRELGIAKKGGAAKEAAQDLEKANAEAAKKAQEDWERASEQINNTLTDALMRGFESGKDFAKNMRDTIVNMFKTMVLRPVVSAIVSPVAGMITGAMGLSGAANAGQSALSTIGTGASIFNAGSALGGLGAVGGAMSGFATAATASVQSLLGMSGTVAQMTTSLAAAGHTAASGVSAGVQAFQAIPGWGWAIAGVAALAAIFSKKSTPHTGGIGAYSAASGATTGSSVGLAFGIDQKHYTQAGEDLSTNVAKSIVGILDATATTFGKQAGYYAATAFADDSGSKDGAWGALRIKFGEKVLLDWADTAVRDANVPREFADGEAGSKEYLAAVAKSARDVLVQAIGDVDWATDMLTALGDSPTLEGLAQTVQQINAAQAAFDALGKNIVGFGALTDGAISQLVKAAGSIDGLVSAASTYYENFYTDAEKTANVTRDVAAALADVGLEMPKTRQDFRALVESQMALGDAGTDAVAALLGVSGAFASVTAAVRSEQALERADRLAAQRAQEKQAAEALQKQIEAYADGAEQFNVLRDALFKAGDAAGLLAAATERAFADPRGAAPKWGANSTAASFNYEYGLQQAAMRQSLSNELSASALRVANVGGALGGLSVSSMMGQDDPVVRAVYIGMRDAMVQAAGDAGLAVRDAVDGAALYAAQAQVRAQFGATGQGLASVYAARESYGMASSNTDVKVYEDAQRKLNGALSSGAIGADQFARALQALNDTLPQAAALSGDFDAQAARAAAALDELAQTGLRSIGYYFGQLNTMALELAKMDEPINATIASIGRLNSFETAFGVSADAAGATGLSSLQIDRAKMIAEAAGIASAAMTTADAAAAAAQLAQSPAFAELGAKGIRDAALLLDGVGQYNAEGFERAFIRISDALAKGGVNEGQYKALFDTALDMFNGVPEETRTLIDSMTRLRDAMSGFADGLLIDEQRTTLSAGATLAEMQRQYAQAFAGASTGDNDAIGKYQQLASTLLDKNLYGSQAEYNAAFGSVYGDARQLESIGINTLANAQGNEMVSELKDMNAKLNKRVEDLEKNLLAALAQIAKNTSDTSRGIEQQIVMAEETP